MSLILMTISKYEKKNPLKSIINHEQQKRSPESEKNSLQSNVSRPTMKFQLKGATTKVVEQAPLYRMETK